MNVKCFKTIFSKRLGCLVAVGEHATSQGKAQGASGAVGLSWAQFVGLLSAGFAAVSLAWAQPANNALPTGGQVAQGAASISTNGANMNIQQTTARAVVNWQSFDIGKDAKVNIQQPGSNSVMLNRVTGANPSQIFGQLNANGQVVLVNPNGVMFGKDGSVTATSFTASTLGITDANFMGGNMLFERNGSAAGVVNQGSLKATGGYVALLGASVSNEGKIETSGGAAYLAAAETVKVPLGSTGRIKLELSPSAINAAVSNSKEGTIVTHGGQVYMQAAALQDAVASIVQSGSIDSTGGQGGAVHLLADGGRIRVDGSIKANSNNGTTGGDIYIGRDKDTNVLAAVGDVSGVRLESVGGFVETSGQFLKVDGARVIAKDWLLDPYNITIVDNSGSTTDGTTNLPTYTPKATSTIKASDIVANLSSAHVRISTGLAGPSSSGTQNGDITIDADIQYENENKGTLTLIANNGITLKQDKTICGNLNLNLDAHGRTAKPMDSAFLGSNSAGVVIEGKVNIKGDLKIQGHNSNSNGDIATPARNGITITDKGNIQANKIELIGASDGLYSPDNNMYGAGSGVRLLGNVKAFDDIDITGWSRNIGKGVLTGAISSLNGNIDILGFSQSETAVLLNGVLEANNGNITVTGGPSLWKPGNIFTGVSKENFLNGSNKNGTGALLGIDGANTAQIIAKNVMLQNLQNVPNAPPQVGIRLNDSKIKASESITLQAEGSSTTQEVTQLLGNTNLTATGQAIAITSDSLLISTMASIDAGNAGTVTIQNKNAGVKIDIGSGTGTSGKDVGSTTATLRTLGLSNAELKKITAAETVIGRTDSLSSGDIKVSATTITASTTGNITLRTGGNIAIDQALTAGDNNKRMNLDLQAGGGLITQAINATITANQLSIQADQASVALAAAPNQVNQLTANVKSLDFKNGNALQIGADATGITASGKIKVETTMGNLNLNQAVTSSAQNDSDAVTLIAEANKSAGESNGGNIVKGSEGSVSVGVGSTAKLYTGSVEGSTGMQALAGGAGSGRYRYNSAESTTNFSKGLEAGVNVIYREAPVVTVKVNDVNKVYDGVAHSGGSFSSTSTAFGLKNGDTDALVGSNAVFSGNAQGVKDVLASVGKTISASDNGKNALGYTVTYSDGSLSITPRPLTIAVGTVADKPVDGTTTATVTPGVLSTLVAGESLGVSAKGNFSDSSVGNGKVVTALYNLEDGINGLASNYVLDVGTTTNPDNRLRGNILGSPINPITPALIPSRPSPSARVVVSGNGNTGAAVGVADEELDIPKECSILNPEKCACEESTIPGVELCYAPSFVLNTIKD